MSKEAAIAALRERKKRDTEAAVRSLLANDVEIYYRVDNSSTVCKIGVETAVEIVMMGRRNWDIKQSGLTPEAYACWERWFEAGAPCTALNAKGKPCRCGSIDLNPHSPAGFVTGSSDRCWHHQEAMDDAG